jgi:putative ATP-binding cassette transporter
MFVGALAKSPWELTCKKSSGHTSGLEGGASDFGTVGVRVTRPIYYSHAALRLRNLSVTLDDGTAVVNDAEVSIMPGEKVLVAGKSGTGKCTLVRAVAGLWRWGEGDIEVRAGAKLSFLPQRPYVPIGTLRRAASYPDVPESRSVQEIVDAFKKVGLEYFTGRLEEEGP